MDCNVTIITFGFSVTWDMEKNIEKGLIKTHEEMTLPLRISSNLRKSFN